MVQLKTLIDDRFAPDSHIMAAMFVKMRTTATDLLILWQKNDAGQESVSWQADSDVYPPVHRSMLLLKHIVHFFTGWKMFEIFPQ